jgi:hypothetical protein
MKRLILVAYKKALLDNKPFEHDCECPSAK